MRLLIVATWVATVLSATVYASPKPEYVYKVKESVIPPRGWTKHSPAPKDVQIELRIALPQNNFPVLEQHLMEIRYDFA